jgi:uncharacterized damage-inducible protein DinB
MDLATIQALFRYDQWANERVFDTVANLPPVTVNHSPYHRGQVATMMRRLGHVPAATDFVGYEE